MRFLAIQRHHQVNMVMCSVQFYTNSVNADYISKCFFITSALKHRKQQEDAESYFKTLNNILDQMHQSVAPEKIWRLACPSSWIIQLLVLEQNRTEPQ